MPDRGLCGHHGRVTTAVVPPKAYREQRGRWLAGVCAGIAENTRLPVALVRVLFVVATVTVGVGVIAYAVYWVVLPPRDETDHSDAWRLLAFGALVVGGVLLWPASGLRTAGSSVALVAIGVALIWQRTAIGQWTDAWALVVGAALILAGIVGLVSIAVGWSGVINGIGVTTLVLLAAGIIAIPWMLNLYRQLAVERQERIRSQTRSELATQVHDSVLQTLTLIRQHAADPDQVVRLARAEERHLRSWLYDPAGDPEQTLHAALVENAGEVERTYAATVDVVCVGDAQLDSRLSDMVAAAREAMVNAAKHAGGAISVYAEVEDARVTVFVRDRGQGFDPDNLPADRLGVRESIIGRMQRCGGTATIRSGESGTEVGLELPR